MLHFRHFIQIERDDDRYSAEEAFWPEGYPYKVTDWYGRGATTALCRTREDAEIIARVMNDRSPIKWSISEKAWVGDGRI